MIGCFDVHLLKQALLAQYDFPNLRGNQRLKNKGEIDLKTGKTKSAFILEAVDEKLGLVKNREKTIREFAGWLSHSEAEELRKETAVFNRVNEEDWH